MKNESCKLISSVPSGHRRTFLKNGLILTAASAMAGITACSKESSKGVSPAEDLMREHGVLNRILLIYDHCMSQILAKEEVQLDAVKESAGIIRSFIEDYHEKLEEKYLFPRFVNASKLVDLVQVLYVQHHAGRVLTDQILQVSSGKSLDEPDKLSGLLNTFNRMYRPHEAREDTILFPALHGIVSAHEYDSMGEDFEKQEHQLFGSDGFESMVNKVAEIEKRLGIYDISEFTPAV